MVTNAITTFSLVLAVVARILAGLVHAVDDSESYRASACRRRLDSQR